MIPARSPLGAGGSYRCLPPPYGGGCEASPTLSSGADDSESEYAALGTAAHTLAAHCLSAGSDAWQHIGQGFPLAGGLVLGPSETELPSGFFCVDKNMADAVQVYLDAVHREHPDRDQSNTWIERRFHCPSVHRLFFGTADLVHLDGDTLHLWDYKHGAGIVVEVQQNPQLMYYAVGALADLDLWKTVSKVVLHIAQPRGWHSSGPIRDWGIGTRDLLEWTHDVLIPAMNRVEAGSSVTRSGEHCRFCSARYRACPQLAKDADELEALMKTMNDSGGAPHLTNEQVGRLLTLGETLKIAAKAARETGFARAEKGGVIPGWKLAQARSNREWKENAETAARDKFSDRAFTQPELKSPAGIDELPLGKEFTSEYAFKPSAGLQLVPASDARQEAGPAVKSMFKPVGKKSSRK